MPDSGLIFNIQRFSLHDGPGIRTTLFFKGCPLRCAWCQNPESIKPRAEMAFVARRCVGCFLCEDTCRESAIVHAAAQRIDFGRCTACGSCARACASGSLIRFGHRWSVQDLVQEACKDRDFFDDSGGGLTLSGGEPMRQWRFLCSFLPVLKRERVHVTLQTCGYFKWRQMEKLLPHLDLVYFDLKHMDPAAHRRCTGVDNARILKNFTLLTRRFQVVVPRMPLVPGVNTTPGNVAATAQFLRQQGHDRIHLLPYHAMGIEKYRWIEGPPEPLWCEPEGPEAGKISVAGFAREGVDAVLYD